jgi:DNA replicative helicase MCM subunit Mcm2 (Cdc46/Mcm family)
VKASNIGQLVKISGIVTRCSDVKPLMQVAVYTCEECGFEIYQVLDFFSGFLFDYRPDMLTLYNKLF